MTGPHERDGRFYGYNQDPYTRDPYRDPYTGYEPNQAYVDDEAEDIRDRRSEPTLRSREFTAGSIGSYLGGLAATAVAAMIGSWLLLVVIVPAIDRTFGERFWADRDLEIPARPEAGPVLLITFVIVLAAGGLMWAMVQGVPAPVTFFRVIGYLITVAAAMIWWQSGQAAETLPLAIAAVILGVGITSAVGWCGGYLSGSALRK